MSSPRQFVRGRVPSAAEWFSQTAAGIAVSGDSGTGKSSLLLEQMKILATQGYGLTCLDPNGDLACDFEQFCASQPDRLRQRVTVLRFHDTERLVGLNPLAMETALAADPFRRRAMIASVAGGNRGSSGNWSGGRRQLRLPLLYEVLGQLQTADGLRQLGQAEGRVPLPLVSVEKAPLQRDGSPGRPSSSISPGTRKGSENHDLFLHIRKDSSMPRKPEIGNVQLYPNRPLKRSDKNGFVLKFYCPIRCMRVRKNCGTRDRREARRILRECQQRLLNGEYLASEGAITAQQALLVPRPVPIHDETHDEMSWDACYERYREHRKSRVREGSLADALSRLQVAERIFAGYFEDRGRLDFGIRDCCTLGMLEYLQERLLAGDECRYDRRSPNTVNSMLGAVMAFVRYCHDHEWIERVPRLAKLDVDDVMKGRPVTAAEFERMLEATPKVVGNGVADSWQFTLRILWESGFRVGDVMDFFWDDDRHIHPVWPKRKEEHPTLVVPSTQKNGEHQVIPMLPGLDDLLRGVPSQQRHGWVVNPRPVEYLMASQQEWFVNRTNAPVAGRSTPARMTSVGDVRSG